MTEPQNTPELRFPEFEGEWTEYQFQSHLSKIETGTNKLRSEDFSGLPLLKMGNIQRGNFTFNKLLHILYQGTSLTQFNSNLIQLNKHRESA